MAEQHSIASRDLREQPVGSDVTEPEVLAYYRSLLNTLSTSPSTPNAVWDSVLHKNNGVITRFSKVAHTDDDYRLLAYLCVVNEELILRTINKTLHYHGYYQALHWLRKIENKNEHDVGEFIKWVPRVLNGFETTVDLASSMTIREGISWLSHRLDWVSILKNYDVTKREKFLQEIFSRMAAIEKSLQGAYAASKKDQEADAKAKEEFEKVVKEEAKDKKALESEFIERVLKIAASVIDPTLARRLHAQVVDMVLKMQVTDNDDRRKFVHFVARCIRELHSYNNDYAESELYLIREALRMATAIPIDQRTREDNDKISRILDDIVVVASLLPTNTTIQRRAAALLNAFYDVHLPTLPDIPLTEWTAIRGAAIEYPKEAGKKLLAVLIWFNGIHPKTDEDCRLIQQICSKGAKLCSRYIHIGNEAVFLSESQKFFAAITNKTPADRRLAAADLLRFANNYAAEDKKLKCYQDVITIMREIPDSQKTEQDRKDLQSYQKTLVDYQKQKAEREAAEQKAKDEAKEAAKEEAKENAQKDEAMDLSENRRGDQAMFTSRLSSNT